MSKEYLQQLSKADGKILLTSLLTRGAILRNSVIIAKTLKVGFLVVFLSFTLDYPLDEIKL